jgi:acetamidase/formamidase
MTIEVVKGAPITWPRIETPTHWITVGYDRDLNKALDILEDETLKFVVESRKLTVTAARAFIAAHGDCRVMFSERGSVHVLRRRQLGYVVSLGLQLGVYLRLRRAVRHVA